MQTSVCRKQSPAQTLFIFWEVQEEDLFFGLKCFSCKSPLTFLHYILFFFISKPGELIYAAFKAKQLTEMNGNISSVILNLKILTFMMILLVLAKLSEKVKGEGERQWSW